ncbi:MAG TPA: hypothetical protein VF157_12000 [Chloroflexota bacterium]
MIDWLLSPAVPLSLLLALIYTLGVHLFMGLGLRRLFGHWLLAIAAMAAGYALAARAHSALPTLGDAHVLEASAAAVAALVLAGLRTRAPSSQ